ncbi:MAG: beta-propeller fold lactonase family protein [Chitinophagaceae bacterium]|nr:beta-propeller fold lactonase family protein [Chitinophagaceae bacterium]
MKQLYSLCILLCMLVFQVVLSPLKAQWADLDGSNTSNSNNYISASVTDAAGNLDVAGTFTNNSSFNNPINTLTRDASGKAYVAKSAVAPVSPATPSITTFTPNNGCSGTSVTITGTNFTGATAVKFGNTNAASFTVNSATSITAVVGNGGTGQVKVITPAGTATSVSNYTYGSYKSYAYVPSSSTSSLNIVDLSTNTVVTTLTTSDGLGFGSEGVCVSPDQSKVYLTNASSNTVSVINTTTNTISATINVDNVPIGIAISPDGTKVYVANNGSNTLSVINSATNTVTATVSVGNTPGGIAVSQDGSKVYVANSSDNTVSVINAATNTVTATIAVGRNPFGITLSPDGSKLYVVNSADATVSAVNTATNTVTATIAVGRNPFAIAVSPDGSKLYVSNGEDGSLSVINTTTNTVTATINLNSSLSRSGPLAISVSSDGTKVYVTDYFPMFSIIDATTNTVSAQFSLGGYGQLAFGNFIVNKPTACPLPAVSLGAYTLSNAASLLAHYDATDSSSLTQVGNVITGWKDISGHNYDLTQSTTGPTLTTINGLQALDFNSAKRFTNTSVPLSQDLTVLMIVKHNTAITTWGNYMTHGDHDNDWSIRHNADANSSVGFHTNNDNSTVLTPLKNDSIYILVGRLTQNGNGTNKVDFKALTYNGSTVTKTATFPTTITSGNKAVFVGTSDLANENSNSKIGEILYFNNSLSDSDLNNAIQYLNDKWFISTVSGGGSGGTESKSLGDAIATRVYKNAVNSMQGAVDYSKLPSATLSSTIRNNNAGTGLKLSDILPTTLSNKAYKSLITTPKDLLAITNAKDILSIDFVKNNVANAVAFGTQTSSEVYDHTKPVCDRLKGSELIGLKNIIVNGINMVQYNLKNNRGETEYATSFILGTKNGRNSYTIQSNWLNKDYTIDETMYNIQLWAGSPSLLLDMANNIVSRMQALQPVTEIKSNAGLPKTYMTAGSRQEDQVTITINNTVANTNGYFEISDRFNEQSTGTVKRTIPVTLTPNGATKINIPSNDLYESTINLYVNGQLQDMVFMADGAWGVDYNTNTTSVKNFTVSNSNRQIIKDEFPVFRDAAISGTTPDYLTLYKLLRAGGAPQDLSAYKTLKFTAAGNSTLHITLVKESITNWKDQYSIDLPISNDPQEYMLGLSDFKSGAFTTPINPNDINSIVISMGSASPGRSTDVNVAMSSISFTKEDIAYIRSLQVRDVTAYPNPSSGRFNVTFKADKDYTLTLKVTEAATGKVINSKMINAVKGDNVVPMNLDANGVQKLYIINLDGNNVKYKPSKLIIGRN